MSDNLDRLKSALADRYAIQEKLKDGTNRHTGGATAPIPGSPLLPATHLEASGT